jgi:DNA polymerase-3 subunit alpha
MYSMMDSIIRPNELFKRVSELGQSSIAITDHSSLACDWEGLQASKKHKVKLIMGCEFYFTDDLADETKRLRHIILLARNHEGYKNLLLASKLANDNNIIMFKKTIPRINWDILKQCSGGLICTTACGSGILGHLINTRRKDEAKEEAKKLKDIFGKYLALEIQPHALKRVATNYNDYEDQQLANNTLIKFGKELDIKVIAATNAHYLKKEQWESHDAWLSIGTGMPIRAVSRLKYSTHEFYVKSRDEVESFFRRLYKNKAAEFCDNTLYFSDMCEDPDWIDPKHSNPSGKELPDFPVKDQDDYNIYKGWLALQEERIQKKPEDDSYFRFRCDIGLKEKIPTDKHEKYQARIEEEADVLEFRRFTSYMLIVTDILDFCRKNNIPTGPARGSAASCLSGYLSGIHQVDPIKYDLIFARFHNREKEAQPDIDIDIASFGRDQVKDYLTQKYGEDNVALVSNIMRITPKVYARDIARAYQFGGNTKAAVEIGTEIADSIPADIKSIKSALTKAPLFMEYAEHPDYLVLKKLAPDLDGLPKVWSTHAGGVVVSQRPLETIVPLRRDKNNNVALEYEKERTEENGLVKIDLLGVSMLDVIDKTLELIKKSNKHVPVKEMTDYDRNDSRCYDLISRGDTVCVFQLGTSGGTIEACKSIKPKSINDLAVINALVRPNAANIRKKFIEVWNLGEKVSLMHPLLERAFSGTYGFALFEECLMYVAKDVAGWNLHDADRLRKLTKLKGKYPEKVAKWREDFINGAVNNKGLDKKIATDIWDNIIVSFGNYAFNRAHAVSYSFISYQTAYLKTYYPLEFLTANLMFEVNSNSPKAADNVLKIKNEIRRMNAKIIPPDINKSNTTYNIINDNTLMTGFDALKYMGKNSVPEILANRPFNSFDNFLSNVNGRKVTSAAVQAMAASGCLDSFGMPRKQMFLYASDFKKKLQIWNKKNAGKPFNYPWPSDVGEWTKAEKYAMEHYYIGEGLCCGIIEAYPGFFNKQAINFSELPDMFPDSGDSYDRYEISGSDGVVQGVIKSYFEFKVKKETSKIFGQTMAKIDIEDPYGNTIAMTLFPSGLDTFIKRLKQLGSRKINLEPGIAIHCGCSLNWYEGSLSLIFNTLKKVAPIPPRPKDLVHRKISMRITSRQKKKTSEVNPQQFLEKVEDELVEDGVS